MIQKQSVHLVISQTFSRDFTRVLCGGELVWGIHSGLSTFLVHLPVADYM